MKLPRFDDGRGPRLGVPKAGRIVEIDHGVAEYRTMHSIVGMAPPVFPRAGDVVRCEIDGIGAIENNVAARPAREQARVHAGVERV